jgi:hypothetical protein
MWDSPLGTSLIDSQIIQTTSSTIGIYNDASKLTGGKSSMQIGSVAGAMSFPYETVAISDQENDAVLGIYNGESGVGVGKSSIYLGSLGYTVGSAYHIFSETAFTTGTNALLSKVSNNFLYRDISSGVQGDTVSDILNIWGDGAVSLNASGTGTLNSASPRLVINEDVTVANPVYKLYVNGESKFTGGGLEAGAFSSPGLAGTGNGLVLAGNTGGLFRTTLPTGTLNRIPKWTATGSLSLGNSQIFDNGTSVAIGNTSPTANFLLDVNTSAIVRNYLQVGTTTVDTSLHTGKIITDGFIETSLGINIAAVTGNPFNKTGLYSNGNKVDLFSANNKIATFGAQVSGGEFLGITASFSAPNAGNAGSLNGLRLQSGVGPANNVSNTTNQTQIIIDPAINQVNGTGNGSGILRGVYYNPTVTNIGNSANKHIALETVNGDVLLGTGSYTAANGGYVGIGSGWTPGNASTMPQRPLHIRDVMRLEPRATAPTSPGAGDIYYDSVTNTLKFYNGTNWRTISSV